VIAALFSEGLSALRSARGTTQLRLMKGLEREQFVNSLIFGAGIMVLSIIVPELSGASLATDKALGSEPSDLMLTWPMLPSMVAAIGIVTALLIWRGPQVTDGLVRLVGGQSTSMDAAIWIYLATVAGIVISLGAMFADLVLGLVSTMSPTLIGWISLGVSCFRSRSPPSWRRPCFRSPAICAVLCS
jgi:hypothetical protein